MAKGENAFLLKARLERELDEFGRIEAAVFAYDEDFYMPEYLYGEAEKVLGEVRDRLSAGSEILKRRLMDREAEAAELFQQGLSSLAKLREDLPKLR